MRKLLWFSRKLGSDLNQLMANRAYLYATEAGPTFTWRERATVPYYDSRHGVPLAWFFFFRAEDILMIDVKSKYGGEWREVKWLAPKDEALVLFQKRQPVLNEIVAPRIGVDRLEHLVEKVSKWPGRYLLMNPWEVAEDDENDAQRFAGIFQAIDENLDKPETIIKAVSYYSGGFDDSDESRRIVNLVGFTYWD